MAYALITGADSKISLEMIYRLIMLKYDIILVSSNPQKLTEIKKELEEIYHINILVFPIDLSKDSAGIDLFNKVSGLDIEVLINNPVGDVFFGQHETFDVKKIIELLSVNIVFMTVICNLFISQMKKRGKRSYIMNISSIAGCRPIVNMAAYSSSKNYIVNFSDILSEELKETNVSVTCICTGPVGINDSEGVVLEKKLFDLFAINIIKKPSFIAEQGIRAMFEERRSFLIGRVFSIVVFIAKAMPRFLFVRITKTLMKNRLKSVFKFN